MSSAFGSEIEQSQTNAEMLPFCLYVLHGNCYSKTDGEKSYLNPRLGNSSYSPGQNTKCLGCWKISYEEKVLIHSDSVPGTKSGLTYRCESLTRMPDSFPAVFPCGYWQCAMHCHGQIRSRRNTLGNTGRNISPWLLSHLSAESLG